MVAITVGVDAGRHCGHEIDEEKRRGHTRRPFESESSEWRPCPHTQAHPHHPEHPEHTKLDPVRGAQKEKDQTDASRSADPSKKNFLGPITRQSQTPDRKAPRAQNRSRQE
jgi:hypothetical protein